MTTQEYLAATNALVHQEFIAAANALVRYALAINNLDKANKTRGEGWDYFLLTSAAKSLFGTENAVVDDEQIHRFPTAKEATTYIRESATTPACLQWYVGKRGEGQIIVASKQERMYSA